MLIFLTKHLTSFELKVHIYTVFFETVTYQLKQFKQAFYNSEEEKEGGMHTTKETFL